MSSCFFAVYIFVIVPFLEYTYVRPENGRPKRNSTRRLDKLISFAWSKEFSRPPEEPRPVTSVVCLQCRLGEGAYLTLVPLPLRITKSDWESVDALSKDGTPPHP